MGRKKPYIKIFLPCRSLAGLPAMIILEEQRKWVST